MGFLRRKTLHEILLEEAELEQTPEPEELEPERPRIEASERAAEFLRSYGGQVYVWLDKSGLSHTTLLAPKHSVEFMKVQGPGFEPYQDTTIRTPRFWALVYHRLLRRVEALYNGRTDLGVGGGG